MKNGFKGENVKTQGTGSNDTQSCSFTFNLTYLTSSSLEIKVEQ